MTPHEIKGVMTGVVVSAVILVAMFTAGRIYRNQYERETQPGINRSLLKTWRPKAKLFLSKLCSMPQRINAPDVFPFFRQFIVH